MKFMSDKTPRDYFFLGTYLILLLGAIESSIDGPWKWKDFVFIFLIILVGDIVLNIVDRWAERKIK